MTKSEIKKEEKERLNRRKYHSSCRKFIKYQIDEYKANNLWSYGKHLDHVPYTFGLIVDMFRECFMKWSKTDTLPKVMIEYTTPSRMFRSYHEVVAQYKVVDAHDNLKKAPLQTKRNNYGMKFGEYNDAIIFLGNVFTDMFGIYHDDDTNQIKNVP